ncbi:MAG TPA: DUF3794 domain-containing protein [Candidatus Limivivens merdigallinarum]|uniref:DUF3794 domain-containing protein n=1 Tax=Candidatus Limivivens merdigallinarum TaxID=2840859 RepID=A0A9D0ZWI9_9FIRM|nr:DUF3794 domain-containing protein [Candidatus Limivivens merdigallinarum]
MELLKKNIHMNWQKASQSARMSLSEDYNIPENQPDALHLVQKKGIVRVDEIKVLEGSILLKGSLEVHILYIAQGGSGGIHRLKAIFPYEERVSLAGVKASDSVDAEAELQDMNVTIINSRKLGVQSLIQFQVSLEELYDVQAGVEVHGVEELSTRTQEINPLSLSVRTRDIVRVKKELTLASNKPNVGEVLWEDVELRGADTRLLEGELEIRGELFVFLLYAGEDEKGTREWMEASLPFQEILPLSGCKGSMVPNIEIALGNVNLEVTPDYDGEERMIQVDAPLQMDIRLYEEEQVKLLKDVYTPMKELIPRIQTENYESLLVRNFSKCRAAERIHMEQNSPRMLQFCHSHGEVQIDESKVTEQGILVEGAVFVTILYVTSDDEIPFAVMEGAVPFSHLVEVEGIHGNCRYTLKASLEQLSAAMIDSEEIEVKANINLNAFVVEVKEAGCVTDIQEQELDLAKLQAMPGMIGYQVQPGDSLWNIAKAYRTTPEKIREWNHLENEEALPGEKLMILKVLPQIH